MTAFHGVLEFYSTKNPLAKFLWFIILCLGFLLAANQSTELILNYVLEEKWITSITAEPPPHGRMKWPNILICKITQTELRLNDLRSRNLLEDPYEIAFLDGDEYGVEFFNRFQASDTLNGEELREKLEELKRKLNCTQMYPLCLQVRDTVSLWWWPSIFSFSTHLYFWTSPSQSKRVAIRLALSDWLPLFRLPCLCFMAARFQDGLTCEDTVIDCGGGAGRVIADVSCDCFTYSSESSKPECFKINASAILRDKPPPSPNTVGECISLNTAMCLARLPVFSFLNLCI